MQNNNIKQLMDNLYEFLESEKQTIEKNINEFKQSVEDNKNRLTLLLDVFATELEDINKSFERSSLSKEIHFCSICDQPNMSCEICRCGEIHCMGCLRVCKKEEVNND